MGPNLNKVVGRKAGSLSGYDCSSAMKETDFVWDEAKLDRFIANPDEVVPGHNMKPYGGLASKGRANEDRRLPRGIEMIALHHPKNLMRRGASRVRNARISSISEEGPAERAQ